MKMLEFKNKIQNEYYDLRKKGVSHATAMSAVVDMMIKITTESDLEEEEEKEEP